MTRISSQSVDIRLHRCGVDPNLPAVPDPCLLGVGKKKAVNRQPGIFAQGLDILLQGRFGRIISRPEPDKIPKRVGVGQIVGQIIVTESPKLFQDRAAQTTCSAVMPWRRDHGDAA